MADMFASTTGTDADWVVKLIDVAPDGQQTMIVDEIFRGRYRKSFETPEADSGRTRWRSTSGRCTGRTIRF